MNVVLLEEVLNHIHNWFIRDTSAFLDVEIVDGSLTDKALEFVEGKEFYKIDGSYLNDGLHRVEDADLDAETVERMRISLLAIPKPLLQLVDEIEEWEEKYGDVASGPYFSEEFGGYKYQVRGFSSYGVSGSPLSGWRLAFANRLNPWRKMHS